MRYLGSITLFLFAACLLPLQVRGQTITRDELLDRLKRVHPFFEIEELAIQIEEEGRKSLLGARDWNVLSSVNYLHEEPAIAIAGPEKTDAFSVEGGVEKVFWNTGGRLTAGFSSSHAKITIDPIFQVPDTWYQNQFAVTYLHPLLKNRHGFLDRLQYELKQYDVDFSEVLAFENKEDFLADVAMQFLDWVYFTEEKRIIQERLRLSQEEFARTGKKRQAHLVEQADLIRAENAVTTWKQNRVLSESRWKAQQAVLAVLTKDDDLYGLIPEFPLYESEELPPLGAAVTQLIESSRLIKALGIRTEQLEYTRRGREEALKPDLSLVTQFNIKAAEQEYGESFKMDKPDAFVGLQFSVPLGNRTLKHDITRTDLEIRQLEKQVEGLTIDLVAALTEVYIRIEELEKVLVLNREHIESAQERTAEELKLYNQGRGELTFVIQSRDNEQFAKLTLASTARTYHKLIVQYRSLLDEFYK